MLLLFLVAFDEGDLPDLDLARIFAEMADLCEEEFAKLDCPVIFAEVDGVLVCDWASALPDSATPKRQRRNQKFPAHGVSSLVATLFRQVNSARSSPFHGE